MRDMMRHRERERSELYEDHVFKGTAGLLPLSFLTLTHTHTLSFQYACAQVSTGESLEVYRIKQKKKGMDKVGDRETKSSAAILTTHTYTHRAQRAGWNGSFSVFQLVGEPVEAFVEPVSAGSTCGLDVPVAVPQ